MGDFADDEERRDERLAEIEATMVPRDAECPYEMAVLIERALKAAPWWDATCEISPPEGESEPDSFGVCQDGELLFVVQVTAW